MSAVTSSATRHGSEASATSVSMISRPCSTATVSEARLPGQRPPPILSPPAVTRLLRCVVEQGAKLVDQCPVALDLHPVGAPAPQPEQQRYRIAAHRGGSVRTRGGHLDRHALRGGPYQPAVPVGGHEYRREIVVRQARLELLGPAVRP